MPISVTVKTLDSQNHKFENLQDEMTVSEFKRHIASTVGTTPDLQRLIYCGRVLQDVKKLNDYAVDGKVIHLVQRSAAPTQGPDEALRQAEARARGASPARGRTHHIHIQQEPDFIPSMTFRLNVARELLERANRTIDRLENPNIASDPPPPTSTSSSTTPNGVPGLSSPMGDMSSQFAQAIQSAVSTAMMQGNNGSGPGRGMNFEMSVQLSGPHHGPMFSAHIPRTAAAATTGATAPSNGTTTSSSTTQTSTSSSETAAAGAAAAATSEARPPPRMTSGQRQLQHPPLSAMADAMDELERTENRFRPFRQRMYDLLRQDPEYSSATEQQNDQMLITRVTSVMHALSHVQHALSDAVINLAQSRPRHLRAQPLMIQSRVQSTVIPNINLGSLRAARTRSTTAPSTGSSASSTSTSTTTATSAASTGATDASSSNTATNSTLEGQLAGAFGEVEVSLEPIIVGIEVDSGITIPPGGVGVLHRNTGNGGGQENGGPHQNLINQMNAIIMNAARAQGIPTSMPSSSSATSTASSTSSSSSTSEPSQQTSAASGQDSQARGAGPQTQPTTSTQTRSSTHVYYGPRRPPFGLPGGPQLSSGSNFDPLLPCNSHHIRTALINGRRSGSLLNQRPRSASMPPRDHQRAATTSNNSNQQPQTQSNQASSARSSPHRIPRTPSFGNLDFEVSTHIDVVPMMMTPQGMVPLGSAASRRSPFHRPPSMQGLGGSGNGSAAEAMEPSLAHLLGALQSNANNDDANMLQVVMGILRELGGVGIFGAGQQPSNSNGRTISAYVEGLPDYSYTEGESLVTDLLMLIARNTTFSDLVNILLGSNNSLDGLQRPLREFLRRYVLVPPNDDEQHDVDAAVLHLVDSSFPQLEEMSREVRVRPDIDFAETMHSFLAANLSALAETVLRAENASEFGNQFRTRGNAFLSRLVALCLRCSTDGNASLERVVRNRLEAISGDVGNTVREWILSAAVGHLRNYVARLDQSPSNTEDIEQYVVNCGSDAEQRQGARRRRLLQYQAREEETFVTPRSSPPRQTPDSMDTDEPTVETTAEVTKKSDKEFIPPPRNLPENEQQFPQSLLAPREVDSTIPIGSQPWHGTLPSSWVPIVSRDVTRQSSQEPQRPFSDAYLTTQSAKRRRLSSKHKPSGAAEEVISEVISDAINATGIQPLTSVNDVMQDTSSQAKVQKSLKNNARETVNRRINQDPDFDAKKYPNTKDFASK